jgi:hypothetical protein
MPEGRKVQEMSIEKAEKTISDFLKKKLGRDAKIIRLEKTDKGWIGNAEVFEDSSFIKSLGLPARVQDRNIYAVSLDNELGVVGYKLKKDDDEDDASGDKNV